MNGFCHACGVPLRDRQKRFCSLACVAESRRNELDALGHDAQQAVAAGSFVVKETAEYYLPGKGFTAERQLDKLATMLDGARGAGSQRLRATGKVLGDLPGLDMEEWWEYERKATEVVSSRQALVLCCYEAGSDGTPWGDGARATHPYVAVQNYLVATP